jgi:hypothetical protein
MKALLLGALLAGAALGASAAPEDPRWYLQVDNDVLFGTDRWYTSGVRIGRVQRSGHFDYELGLLQEIYTPEGKRFVPGTVDRAPIGRLLLYGARHEIGPACLQTAEVEVGVRGRAALGRRTTEVVHSVVPSPFVDWDREAQTHLDGQVSLVHSQRYGFVTTHLGGSVGDARIFGHAGVQLDFGTPIASPVLRFAATPPPPSGASAWGGFVGVSARAVARDALLDRSYDPALPPPARENVVGRLAGGLGIGNRWGSLSVTAALDSREFDGQRQPHAFGSLLVHFEF